MEKKTYTQPETVVFICKMERCILSDPLDENEGHSWVEPATPKDGHW